MANRRGKDDSNGGLHGKEMKAEDIARLEPAGESVRRHRKTSRRKHRAWRAQRRSSLRAHYSTYEVRRKH